MKKSYLFLADGFEEIEALTVVDMLRRAEMPLVTVSVTDNAVVTGAQFLSWDLRKFVLISGSCL